MNIKDMMDAAPNATFCSRCGMSGKSFTTLAGDMICWDCWKQAKAHRIS